MSAGGKEVGRISIRVLPDTDDFRKILEGKLKAIEDGIRVKVKVVPDMDGFREKVRAETEGFGDVEIGVDLDAAGAKAHMSALVAELKARAGRGVDINVGVDRNLIANGISSFASSLSNAGNNAGSASNSFMGLTRTGWLVAAVFVAAAPAIGLVAGLLAGLPSLLTAAIAPMGAVALGLDGIKQAADAAGIMSEGKKGKQGPGGILKELQGSVSEVFQTGLTPVFEQFTRMLPMLKAGFGEVAQGVVNMAQGFANLMTAPAVMNQLQSTFANIGGFLTQLTPTLTSFTQTFITLGQIGSANFGKLVAPLQTFAMQFEQMINKVSASGVLDKAFTGLSETLGSLLNLFTRLFESGLEAMGQLGGPLSNMVNGLGDALIAMMPALTSFSSLIANTLGAIGTAIAPAITAVTPALTQFMNLLSADIAQGLSNMAPILTQIATALGDTMLTAINALLPILPSLLSTFQQMSVALSGSLAQVLPQLATAFSQMLVAIVPLIPQFQQLLLQGLIPSIPAFTQLAVSMVPLVQGFADLVTNAGPLLLILVQVAAGMLTLGASLASGVIGSIQEVGNAFDTITNKVSEFSNQVQIHVNKALAVFVAFPGQVMGVLAGLGESLYNAGAKAIQRFVDGIKSVNVVGAVSGVLGTVMSLIPHSPAKEGPFSGSGWTSIYTGGQAVGQAFNDGLKDGFQGVVQQATSLLQQVQQAVSQGVVPPDLKKNLQQELKAIGVEYDQLKVARDNATDPASKKSITEQMKQLQTLRDELRLQSDQLGYGDKYGDKNGTDVNQLGQQANKMIDIVKGFGQANLSQFENDIGISGHGAIPQLADQGLSWLSGMLSKAISGGMGGGTTINVGSVDEALTADRTIKNREALQYNRR